MYNVSEKRVAMVRGKAKKKLLKKGLKVGVASAAMLGGYYMTPHLSEGVLGLDFGISDVAHAQPAGPMREAEVFVTKIRSLWSTNKQYQTQTNFLMTVYRNLMSYKMDNIHFLGYEAPGSYYFLDLRRKAESTYSGLKPALSEMFKGTMADNLAGFKWDKYGALEIDIEYDPKPKSKLAAKYSNVRIKYHLGEQEFTDMYEVISAEGLPNDIPTSQNYREKDVEVVEWSGLNKETNSWEKIVIPPTMQPTYQTVKKSRIKIHTGFYGGWSIPTDESPRPAPEYGLFKRLWLANLLSCSSR